MNTFLFLSLLVVSANCFYIDNGEAQRDKIVGGDYSSIEAVPYHVQILFNGEQKCGGSIISEQWIVSAAHCYHWQNQLSSMLNKANRHHNYTAKSRTDHKISGFGYIAEGGPDSPLLKAALAPVVSRKKCQEAYSDDDITENMFCAGKGATDNCEGDSGGPAVIDNKLVGIISWGYECGSPKNPGVYTQIYRYRKWIAKNTGLKL